MADLPYDRDVDAQHAQQRRDSQRVEEQRRDRAADARELVRAAAAQRPGQPPRTQRLKLMLSIPEELRLERAAAAAGLSKANFARAAADHFARLLDPKAPPSQQRSDRPAGDSPPRHGAADRSAPQKAEPSQLERVAARAGAESVVSGESLPDALRRVAEEERER